MTIWKSEFNTTLKFRQGLINKQSIATFCPCYNIRGKQRECTLHLMRSHPLRVSSWTIARWQECHFDQGCAQRVVGVETVAMLYSPPGIHGHVFFIRPHIDVDGWLEYDGWYDASVDVTTGGKFDSIRCERLRDLDFRSNPWPDANTQPHPHRSSASDI